MEDTPRSKGTCPTNLLSTGGWYYDYYWFPFLYSFKVYTGFFSQPLYKADNIDLYHYAYFTDEEIKT